MECKKLKKKKETRLEGLQVLQTTVIFFFKQTHESTWVYSSFKQALMEMCVLHLPVCNTESSFKNTSYSHCLHAKECTITSGPQGGALTLGP